MTPRRLSKRDSIAVVWLEVRQQYYDAHEHLIRMPILQDVHPQLLERASKLAGAMQAAGFPIIITDGIRTQEKQQALYAQGRTLPGKIVTYADGINVRSNHQVHEDDQLGHALDCTFINPSTSKPFWPVDPIWMHRWRAYGRLAVALGLEWGGDWKRPDLPHIQLR